MKLSSNSVYQADSKHTAYLHNAESEEAELTPSFTFGVIDDSNISEEVLYEGVHAKKPNEIQRIADNMNNNPLSTQKKVKNQTHSKDNEITIDKEIWASFNLYIQKDWSISCETLMKKSSANKISLKEEVHELLHELVISNKLKNLKSKCWSTPWI